MSFSPSVSTEDTCGRFIELRKKIIRIKNKHGLPEDDGRVQAFNNLAWSTVSIISRLNIILALNNRTIPESTVRQLIGLETGDIKIPMEADLTFTRLSYTAIFNFQIENLLKNILAILEKKNPPQSFYRILEKILKILSIVNSEEKFDILYSMALMRNCLHSNGIHTQETKHIKIKGHEMNFVEGQSYEGGNLDEIHFVANEMLDVLEEILDHEKVKNLDIPLPKQFTPKSKNDS